MTELVILLLVGGGGCLLPLITLGLLAIVFQRIKRIEERLDRRE